MKGQLYLYHVDKDPPDKDINLLVVITNRIIPGWVAVPGLSPSEKLLKRLEKWQWDLKWPRMWPEFEKAYKSELMEQPLKYMHAKHLLKRLTEGNNVAVACDCTDEKHCHKQVIGEWISDQGIEVIQGKEVRKKRKSSLSGSRSEMVQLSIESLRGGDDDSETCTHCECYCARTANCLYTF